MKSKMVVLVMLVVVTVVSGCSSQTGWRFSFAISPVTAIDEKQQLNDKRVELKNADQRRY